MYLLWTIIMRAMTSSYHDSNRLKALECIKQSHIRYCSNSLPGILTNFMSAAPLSSTRSAASFWKNVPTSPSIGVKGSSSPIK